MYTYNTVAWYIFLCPGVQKQKNEKKNKHSHRKKKDREKLSVLFIERKAASCCL